MRSSQLVFDDPVKGIQFDVPEGVWYDTCLQAYEDINCPRALTCAVLLRAKEFVQLASLKCDPHDFNSYEDFSRAYVATELLRKFSGLPGLGKKATRETAMKKAADAERQCGVTNQRLRTASDEGFPPSVWPVVQLARRKISDVCGHFSVDEWLRSCRWGPGSDVLNKRPFVSSYHKFRGGFSATRSCRGIVHLLTEVNTIWSTWFAGNHSVGGTFSPLLSVFDGNTLTTVPKSALTDRSICVEPSLNIYLQLGIGRMLRKRLLWRARINLDDQTWNGYCALWSSKDNHLATIDLSSASDTVSLVLLQTLFSLPKSRQWLRAMDTCRSARTNWGTKRKAVWKENQKFSSMGNGYTFELETLIFWALCSAVCELESGSCEAVYGDDIIVDRHSYDSVVRILEFFGFSVNERKSFKTSFFRESCGMDAWDGTEIKTYRLEQLNNLADVYSFHNGLRRIGLKRAASRLLKCIPKDLRFFGPESLGDVVLWNPSVTEWNGSVYGRVDQWFFWGYRVRCLQFVPKKVPCRDYEPAILHSFSTMRSDENVIGSCRWGTEGFATLSTGVWHIGEALVCHREVTS